MSFNFVCDRIVKGKAYPALAKHQAEPYTTSWQEFVQHWPYTVPCELIEHCNEYNFPYTLHDIDTLDQFPPYSLYPIGIGFFDFSVDYFKLMSNKVIEAVRQRKLRVLFYYHEGDSPYRIKERLDILKSIYELPNDCYLFVSGNTAVNHCGSNFIYFPDHELLYWRRNKHVAPLEPHTNKRDRDFTALSRTHKLWRASVMADLHRNGLLDNSYWSYRTDVRLDHAIDQNPIDVDSLNLTRTLREFINGAPYYCDQLTTEEHNDHSIIVPEHFTNSYCNLVLETHFDAEQSGGAFLTEKTFKAIKHGQPFIIIGTPYSLNTLKQLGYRTFDHAIDNGYDSIDDNTERWRYIFRTISKIKDLDLNTWYAQCLDDIKYNQQLFNLSKFDRLNKLCYDFKHTYET